VVWGLLRPFESVAVLKPEIFSGTLVVFVSVANGGLGGVLGEGFEKYFFLNSSRVPNVDLF
jgi:hypothetical protein